MECNTRDSLFRLETIFVVDIYCTRISIYFWDFLYLLVYSRYCNSPSADVRVQAEEIFVCTVLSHFTRIMTHISTPWWVNSPLLSQMVRALGGVDHSNLIRGRVDQPVRTRSHRVERGLL
jgi:hypothetical protein